MAFTLRQLQYFISVAEQGTVSGAAQSLSISQSAVTEAIQELEGDLGVTLFERHRRGLAITHKGHQFYRHAQRILADVSDARRTFAATEAAAAPGTLHLGVTSLVAGYVLSDLLARYRRAYPSVTVSAIGPKKNRSRSSRGAAPGRRICASARMRRAPGSLPCARRRVNASRSPPNKARACALA